MQLKHLESDQIVVEHLRLANTFFSRLRGLMFSAALPKGHGLWITPCQQIHTQFMRYAVDVIFLDAHGTVLHIQRAMRPWRFTRFFSQASAVVEMNAGAANRIQIGDQLQTLI